MGFQRSVQGRQKLRIRAKARTWFVDKEGVLGNRQPQDSKERTFVHVRNGRKHEHEH
jgi:hypothetical protein